MMKRITIAFAATALVGGLAWAHGGYTGGTTGSTSTFNQGQDQGRQQVSGSVGATGTSSMSGGQQQQQGIGLSSDAAKTHLGQVDFYLTSAIDNAKLLYNSTQLQPSSVDTSLQREDARNIDWAIQSCLAHLTSLKNMQGTQATGTFDEIQRSLEQAKNVSQRLSSAVQGGSSSQIGALSSQLFSNLKAADDSLTNAAQRWQFTRLDQMQVPERQPVSGTMGPGLDNTNLGPGGTVSPQSNPNLDNNLNEPTPRSNQNLQRNQNLNSRPGGTSTGRQY